MTGGHYDVDLSVKDPHGKIIYDEKKKQYDSVNFDADVLGKFFKVLKTLFHNSLHNSY